MNLTTAEQLLPLYDAARDMAIAYVRDEEMILPHLLCAKIASAEGGGYRLATLNAIGFPDFSGRVEQKQAVNELARLVLSEDRADACVFVSEAWMVVSKSVVDYKTAREHRKTLPKSLEHAPGRTEGVLMVFYARAFQAFAACPIERPTKTLGQGSIELDFYSDNFVMRPFDTEQRQ